MKVFKKVLIAIIAIPLVLMVIIMFAAAPVGRKYVNTHGEELIGRRLQLEGFTFNYLTGCASLDDLTVYEKDGDSVFMTIEDFDLNLSMLDLIRGKVGIESVSIDDATVYIVQKGPKFNFDDILEFFKSDEEASEYKIGNLEVDGLNIVYTDMTEPTMPFSYEIKDFELEADNFTTTGHNHIEINAELGGDGEVEATYDGSITNMDDITLKLNIKDVDLVALSPMFIQMFGKEVTSGTFEMQSEVSIINRHINATNHIIIDNPKVQKVKGLSFRPEYKSVPLKTALYFLKDKHDKCEIDLPITGSLDDPKFSYQRTLMRSFGRFIVKVISSPFRKRDTAEIEEIEEEEEEE